MKKLLLLFTILFFFQLQSKASHDIGGEIWWDCLNDGRFVFHAKLYRDCSGISFSYKSKELKIVGNSFPKDSNNVFLIKLFSNQIRLFG